MIRLEIYVPDAGMSGSFADAMVALRVAVEQFFHPSGLDIAWEEDHKDEKGRFLLLGKLRSNNKVKGIVIAHADDKDLTSDDPRMSLDEKVFRFLRWPDPEGTRMQQISESKSRKGVDDDQG